MAEHSEHPEHKEEPLIEQIADKIHFDRSSSSSSSDSDNETKPTAVWEPESSVKSKIWRIFGREKPVHHVFGGGKSADVFLWRNKKISASVLGGATIIWVFFEFLEYHLLSLVSHLLIFSLPILFLWSNATTFINKKRPHIPEVHFPEEPVLEIASALRIEINRALSVLQEVASGRDLKKFLAHLYSSIQF